MSSVDTLTVDAALAGKTLAAAMRSLRSDVSWSQIEKQIERSAVRVNRVVCRDAARRLQVGDVIEWGGPDPKPVDWAERVRILHVDHHLAVIDKPSGLITERRPEERRWPARRKALQPTLDELLPPLLAVARIRQSLPSHRPIILVHRLDRDTSGVIVVARTKTAAEHLISQFRQHSARRVYRAVVAGHPGDIEIRSRLVRDRGDGLRGSIDSNRLGREAITHVRELEKIGPYSLIECRLETGRTNQIRIHLAEQNCLVCGDVKYNRHPDGAAIGDHSAAPRLALHALELEFVHPMTQQPLRFVAPWPDDMYHWLDDLRRRQT